MNIKHELEMRDAVTDKILQVSTSGKFTAILDCLLGIEPRTEPALASLVITSDNCLLGQQEGDVGFNDFFGSATDLFRNLRGIAEAAELTEEETEWLVDQAIALK